MKEAAHHRLRLGQFKKYCDTLCLLGEWDRALAIAPVVGIDYWKSLMKRYSERLLGDSKEKKTEKSEDNVVPFLLAASERTKCVEYLLNSCDNVEGAYLVATVAEDGIIILNLGGYDSAQSQV